MRERLTGRLTRRSVVAAIGGVAALLARGSAAHAGSLPVGAIRVTGTRNVTLHAIAPMVADQIATILGERYRPGDRGGAILLVDLTEIVLDDFDGGANTLVLPFGHGGGADQLFGQVALIGPHREALAAFPMFAQSGAILRAQARMFPDPRRLDMLARAFAWWTVGKL